MQNNNKAHFIGRPFNIEMNEINFNNPQKQATMRRTLIIATALAFAVASGTKAQGIFSENMFNHYAVGVTVGSPGIGLDVATTVGTMFQLRAGFAGMPKFKANPTLDVSVPAAATAYGIKDSYDFQGKLNMFNGKILIDFFPFEKNTFHITAGAYFGSTKLIKVYNKVDGELMPITQYNTANPNNQIGVQLGKYLLKPDANGNVNGEVKVNGFKPYLGLGFGRAVPKVSRIGYLVELGCQFWGKPKVYAQGEKLSKEDTDGKDGGFVKTMSKFSVFPVLNFAITYRFL